MLNYISIVALLLSVLPSALGAESTVATETGTLVSPTPKAFQAGETLEYTLQWSGITAGQLTIHTLPKTTFDDQDAWKFQLKAKTKGLADKIYRVRLNISSYLTEDLSCSLEYYADKVEGSRTKVQRFTYDWDAMRVHYQKNRTVDRGKRELKAKSYDPLGMFFAIRNMTIDDTTKELKIWVSDGKENMFVKVPIGRKETIKVNGKEYETYLIEPDLKHLKGVFSKSDDAKLQLWMTTDERHIPVRIKSKVSVGSFTAELSKYKQGTEEKK